jgi:hypothetical protein
MDTKHTPGPWEVRCGQETNRPRAIVAPNDTGPGGVGSIVRWNGIGFPSSPAAQANARLIAAAPDMLEALQEIADGLANTGSTPGQWMTRIRKDDAWRIAAAAIRKATGEQS